jgi:hypothetical protein
MNAPKNKQGTTMPTPWRYVAVALVLSLVGPQGLPAQDPFGPPIGGLRRLKGRPAQATPPQESPTSETSTEAELVRHQAFEANAVEATLSDRSVLRLYLADEIIEIATPHGNLKIPTEDVMRIEFAFRPPPEIAQLIEEKINQLKDGDTDVGKAAAAELVAMREQSYLALTKAAKSGDPNLAPQAAKVLDRLKKVVSQADLAAMRTTDFIVTPETKVAGQIVNPYLKIRTAQFGNLELKLADARNLRHQSLIALTAEQEDVEAAPDPGNLKAFESQQGKVFAFKVTGTAAGGNVWGTDTYTTDSKLSMAAVHAGVVKVGETGVVHLKIIASPASFAGGTRNGITTSNYGRYTAAYQILKGAEEE